MAFASPATQQDFWTEFAALLAKSDLRASSPSTRNHCSLAIGTSLGKLVVTAPTAEGGVACKLALNRSGSGGAEAARAIHRRLTSERQAIERELGFHDLDWGSDESDTRVYRYRSRDISSRSEWPAAQAWLVQTAAGFMRTFGRRLRLLADEQGVERSALPSPGRGKTPARGQERSRDRAAEPGHIDGAIAKGRTSVGWRDTDGDVAWVDEGLQRLARHAEVELRTGWFPNGDRWSGVYSADEPEPAYRYAFGQWWGDPSLSTSVAWMLLNPATGDTDGRPGRSAPTVETGPASGASPAS